MRHFFLLIIVALAGYFAWQAADKRERKKAASIITKHGLRIAGILLVAFVLLAVAVNFPASAIF